MCYAFRSNKGKDTISSKDKAGYAFDITKFNRIFDYFLKDNKIWLFDSHKIPPTEEIKEGRFKLANKRMAVVDDDPFSTMEITMISLSKPTRFIIFG